MPVGYYNSDTLITAIKRKAMLPTNQNTFSEDDFLAFANEELKIGIAPTVLSLHEEFYVHAKTVALEASVSAYEIPYRATGGRLRDVFYQDTNGNLVEMSRIAPEDKALYQSSSINTSFLFYYVEGNNIILTPSVGASVTGSLVFTFYMRPSDLVSTDRAAIITAMNVVGSNTVYSVDQIPTGFATSTLFDLLQSKPGHKIRKYDIAASAIDTIALTITFATADIDDDTEVGDSICFASECIIPQCPSDLHPILAQRAAARCLEALGDTQGLTNANTKLQEMENKSVALIDNRVDGSPQKIVNNRGLLQNAKVRRKGWW